MIKDGLSNEVADKHMYELLIQIIYIIIFLIRLIY